VGAATAENFPRAPGAADAPHHADRLRETPGLLDPEASAPDPIEEMRRQAEQRLGADAADFTTRTRDSAHPIPREGEITFLPEVPGVEFNPLRRTFIWLEPVHCEEFRVRARREVEGTIARGRLSVFSGALLVADVPLALEVRGEHERALGDPEPAMSRGHPYRRIFPSYSHADHDVVRHCEHYAKALGDRYLRDTVALRAGERWQQGLMALIREADVFQLFWSNRLVDAPGRWLAGTKSEYPLRASYLPSYLPFNLQAPR
jgi:hypothetical protein